MRITLILLLLTFGYQEHLEDADAASKLPTRFAEDVNKMILRQVIKSPDSLYLLAVYFDESGSLSGNKVVKLYDKDSVSIDERHYGAHPLEVLAWKDSTITIKAGVFSAHGDSAYRKWYLDKSVDKNSRIGFFDITYRKEYNYHIK